MKTKKAINEWSIAESIAKKLRVKKFGSSYESTLSDIAIVRSFTSYLRDGKSVNESLDLAKARVRFKEILLKGGIASIAGLVRTVERQSRTHS